MTNFKKKYETVSKMNKIYKITLSAVLILVLMGIVSASTVIDSTSIYGILDITSDDSDLNPVSPIYQASPFNTSWSTTGNYSVNGTGNNFHFLSWVKNYGSQNTVAVFGEGIAENSYSQVWGGNFVAYANSSGATGIGTEVNYGSMASGGNAYGIVLASAGDYPTDKSIQFQSNTAASIPDFNIYFNSGDGIQPATVSLIGTSDNITVPVGLNFTDANFSSGIGIALGQDQVITISNATNYDTQIIGLNTGDTLWIGSGTAGAISLVAIPSASGSLRIQSLAGSGNAFACIDADGDLYRSATACV